MQLLKTRSIFRCLWVSLLLCVPLSPAMGAVINYDQFGLTYSGVSMTNPKVIPKGGGLYFGKTLFLNQKGGGLAIKGGYEQLDTNTRDNTVFGFSSVPSNAQGTFAKEVVFNQRTNFYYIQADLFEPLTSSLDFILGLGILQQDATANVRAIMSQTTEPVASYDVSSAEYVAFEAQQQAMRYGAYYYQLGFAQALGSLGYVSTGLRHESTGGRQGYWLNITAHTDAPVDIRLKYQKLLKEQRYELGVLLNF